jgi:hypothetical protein
MALFLTYRSYALSLGAAAMLVGCTGSVAPAVPAGSVVSSSRVFKPSEGATQKTELLYITAPFSSPNKLYVFTFPDAKYVKVIRVPHRPEGLCTDEAGNIFVTTVISNAGEFGAYLHADARHSR